jgi:hypothetical protein
MSNISIGWHMIIRGSVHEAKQALDSLQGLYDKIVIAVDDRDDSDEVYQLLLNYPNMYAFRQKFSDFARYDLARQDALDKIPNDIEYIGWSDSDEILMTNPIEIRKWLFEKKPEAVNCGINYRYGVGGHEAGKTYRNGRIRIWRANTRYWTRPCHEFPAAINGIENYVEGDIFFDHIKEDNSSYRSRHHIELMQEEIDKNNNIGWKFFQAKEYRIQGDIDIAIDKYYEYLESGDALYVDEAIIQLSELCLSQKQYEKLVNLLIKLNLYNPLANEYSAIAVYYLGDMESAIKFHSKAKELNINDKYSFIVNNDKYYV